MRTKMTGPQTGIKYGIKGCCPQVTVDTTSLTIDMESDFSRVMSSNGPFRVDTEHTGVSRLRPSRRY